ncbi:MAG TPA: DUF3037 domain-containing protein [Candidatus Angelobacter sp.]|nr:DUF3037 domain-containing protein [Candidatus Angelobacter sp.]
MPTYEWAVLRVVPRVERGECVNVGVVVYCRALDYLRAGLAADLSRAQALDPELDVDAVRSQLDSVAAVCRGDAAAGDSGRRAAGDRFRWLVAPRSTVVQPSPVHTGITDDPARELADLMARMVSTPPRDTHGQ